MKTLKTILPIICFFTFFAFISCNNDPEVTCAENFNYLAELQTEINAVNAAGQAYNNDPSNANCEAYRSALLTYIDALRDLEDCARDAGQVQDWQQSLDEAEDNANTFLC